jgi:hypothetical protein
MPPAAFHRPHPLVAILVVLSAVTLAASAADVDPAGPKAALKQFYEAMEAGDAKAVRAVFHTTTDDERTLADAFAAQLTAARALGEAAKAKFAATGDALSRGLPLRDEIAKLDPAAVTIEGDNATVKLPGQAKPLRLVKGGEGRWRISIADYAGVTPENLAAQTAVLRDMATVFNTVAADIAADKFPSATEAQRALQQKLQAVLFNTLTKHPPTTAKATTRPIP